VTDNPKQLPFDKAFEIAEYLRDQVIQPFRLACEIVRVLYPDADLDRAYVARDAAEIVWQRIVDSLKTAHNEHGNSWRNGDEDALRRCCKDESWSELAKLHVLRKLQAYKQGGECDLDQLIGAINYILLQAGRHINNEAE